MNEENAQVLLEIERLRGDVGAGFARIDGRFDTFAQQNQEQGKDIEELQADMKALTSKVWVLTVVAATLGTGGGAGLARLLAG